MKEAKKEAEALTNAFRGEKEAAYQANMKKVRLCRRRSKGGSIEANLMHRIMISKEKRLGAR